MNPVFREILIFIGIVGSTYLYFISTPNNGLGLAIVLLFYSYPAYLLIRLFIWSIMALIRYYQKLKIEQRPLLNKTTLSIGAVLLVLAGCNLVISMGTTAVVIDAETGKPIEGAIALAQWNKPAGGALFEGGSEALYKTKEGFSVKDGVVHIFGYWGVNIIALAPRLTVYKPGYVLWDSEKICPIGKRTDFDRWHRTVKLLKFEPEALKWFTANPIHNGPGSMHESFFSCCCRDIPHEMKFEHIFRDNELPQRKKEEEKARLFEKSLESRRPLHAHGGNQTWPDNYIGEYSDLGNGIIHDSISGLEWEQGTASGNWGQALDYCDNLSLGGYHDWRLPTLQELKTLAIMSNNNQSYQVSKTAYFRVLGLYWSSSAPCGYDKISATSLKFVSGVACNGCSFKDRALGVRCVRGGK